MTTRTKRPSPILGTATAMIDEASGTLVTQDSRFRHTFEAPMDRIRPNPDQARKVFQEEGIKSLADTMAENGQLQPILLRRDPEAKGHWIIVAGERRWRAAQMNGWTSILAIEHDADPEVAALIENLQRVDLTPVEEAKGLQRLIEDKGWSQNKAAEALGKSKGEISATLRILSLPVEILDAVLTSELDIPKNALVELARVETPEACARLVQMARAGLLTVRAIRAAREEEENRAGKAVEPAARITSSRPSFNLKTVDRVAERLRALHASGRVLGESDRERLKHLKTVIEEMLAQAS